MEKVIISKEAKQKLIDSFKIAMNMENENGGNDFRRGKGIGMQKGIEKTLKALGLSPVFDDEWNLIDIKVR